MKSKGSGSNKPKSLSTRNERMEDQDYVVSDDDEKQILEAIRIPNHTTTFRDLEGTKLNWYGARLNILKNFHNKSSKELSVSVGVSEDYITKYISNQLKPRDIIIDKFAFLFEVPKDYFTNDEVIIKLNKQIKLEII